MEITVRDEERDPKLRVRWYEGTSTFHIDVCNGKGGEVNGGHWEHWSEVTVWTHYGDDKGNPPTVTDAVRHASGMVSDGSARELADAEIAQ